MSKLMKQARLLISAINVIKAIMSSGKGSKTKVKIEIKFSDWAVEISTKVIKLILNLFLLGIWLCMFAVIKNNKYIG